MASIRKKLTNAQVHSAYDKAKYVYDNPKSITKVAAALDLHLNEGMNEGTAIDFLRVFQRLVEGRLFKRALSKYAMDYFLFNISNDYDNEALQKALSALISHISYREEGDTTGRKPVTQNAMREVYNKFSKYLVSEGDKPDTVKLEDEREQEAISKETKNKYRNK